MNDVTLTQITKRPACKHMHSSGNVHTCTWLSEALGIRFDTTAPFCNYTCRLNDGPYAGAKPGPNAHKLVHKTLECMFGMTPGRTLWTKVLYKYLNPTKIAHTPQVEKLKHLLEPYRHLPGVQRILLTGSVLVHGQTHHKDYDVVVVVDDYATAMDAGIQELFPKQLDGVPVEVFFNAYTLSFMVNYDPWTRQLYAYPGLGVKPVDESIDLVYEPGDWRKLDEFLYRWVQDARQASAGGPYKLTAGGVARSVGNALGALTGAARAPVEVVESRRLTCMRCSHHVPAKNGGMGTCGQPVGPLRGKADDGTCGCYLPLKTQAPLERCPKGKWEAHHGQS